MKQNSHLLIVPVAAILTAVIAGAWAAPAPKSAGTEVVGTLKMGSLNSPIVVIPRDGEEADHWLIFADQSVEAQANKLEAGQRIRVRGRLAVGGGYRYVIVNEIGKDE